VELLPAPFAHPTAPRHPCKNEPSQTLFPDSKAELLKLNQALLVLFLELLSVLVEQPSAYAETLTRVIGALQNMQHLINLRRPEQVGRLGLAKQLALCSATDPGAVAGPLPLHARRATGFRGSQEGPPPALRRAGVHLMGWSELRPAPLTSILRRCPPPPPPTTLAHPAPWPQTLPPQARHTLEEMLRHQIAKKREALVGLQARVAGVREQLTATAAALAAAGGDTAESARQAAPVAGPGTQASAPMDTS
jgi:hypothetical protein